ncbi:MAG: hypothetical protein IJT02_03005 [Synergistaceae bacterium]|nr:hypothetical protein [Synergistaceae bacterium]
MSNISIDPIRWQTDTLSTYAEGMLVTTDSAPMDLSSANTVTGIEVSGYQPDGTSRYVAFKVRGQWGRLTGSGTFSAFSTNKADMNTLRAYGNTPEELTALTNVPALAGQKFGIALGLSTDDLSRHIPLISLTFKCRSTEIQYTTSQYSPRYDLAADAQVINIWAEAEGQRDGMCNVYAQYTAPDGHLSEWTPISDMAGVCAKAVQLRADFSVQRVGAAIPDRVNLGVVKVIYATGGVVIPGSSESELITKTEDWYMPVHSCRVTVNHSELEGSTLKLYASFRPAPERVTGTTLGTGTGARQTFTLLHRTGIRPDGFQLYYDGEPAVTDFEVDGQQGTVSCTAPVGTIITCDYECGWSAEEWQELPLTSRYDMGTHMKSEYRLAVHGNTDTCCALRAVTTTESGVIYGEALGAGTGRQKTYKLKHPVKGGEVKLIVNGTQLSEKYFALHEDAQHITASVTAGQAITANYEWQSNPPSIYQIEAVFSE